MPLFSIDEKNPIPGRIRYKQAIIGAPVRNWENKVFSLYDLGLDLMTGQEANGNNYDLEKRVSWKRK
ncbi:hypothetical protein CRP01_36315 [Flavilitoribacter nigricans DSM 23189 = NBRC 102662]|uniref:Uncharacterized protein n=1 Tax=Flavilitoribacter nigricans (strain ATCC 23147 / DSM 23189 / NBRC 102662 / NCIMB 1420 / SS-2) TaxID=1122177 RepID=A0A2D0MZK6_FLAN2|nr:hypothetical protein CRP01_36315 [Flavilitoribacter nigricans DSM 23189 = NBRC 102662]